MPCLIPIICVESVVIAILSHGGIAWTMGWLSPSHTGIKTLLGPSTDAHPRGEMELFLVSGIGPRWKKWVTCNTPLTFLSPDHQFMNYLSVTSPDQSLTVLVPSGTGQ